MPTLRFLTGIGMIAGENLTSFPMAIFAKQLNTCSYTNKINKRKVQPLHYYPGLVWQHSVTKEVTNGIEKNPDREPTAIMFLPALVTLFNQVTWRVV